MSLWGLPSWLFWSAGLFSLAAAFLLHFLRVRSRPVTVPTILFWREAVREKTPRVLFRRLARLGSLLLVLLVLLSLLFSAGEPGPSGEDAEYRVYLLDPAALALPAAKKETARILEKSVPGGRGRIRCAFLAAARPCRPLSTFEDPPLAVLGAMEELRGETDLSGKDWGEGIRTAAALLSGKKKASLVVLAVDPSGLPRTKTLPGGIALHVVLLPAPLWDDGVEAAQPVEREDGKWDLLVRASRRGKGGPVRSLVVRIPSGREEVKLLDDKEGRAEVVLRGLPPGSKVTARLSGKDFVSNDTAFLEIPQGHSIRVFCPGAGPVLEAALGAVEGVEATDDPASAQVAVLRTREGAARAGLLPALLFGDAAGQGGSGKASPWRTASLHPLVEDLAFSGVRSRTLPQGKAGATPLVRNAVGVTVAFTFETRRPGERGPVTPKILVAADPEDRKNGLSECPDFPRFLQRALRALSGLPFVEDGIPAGGWGEVRKGLDGGRVEFRTAGYTPFGIPLREGRAEWPFLGGADLAFDRVKSANASCGGPPVAGDLSRAGEKPGGPFGGGPPPAFWLGLLGLLFLTIEWWAFNRGRAA